MKLPLILFFAMAYSALAKNVAVRVVLKHEGKCKEADMGKIQSDVINAVKPYQDRRALRGRRLNPWYCSTVCQGIPKGYCFLASGISALHKFPS
jgi:hypothetical protein